MRAFSLSQVACTLSLHVQLPASVRSLSHDSERPGEEACFDEVNYLGARSGRQHRETRGVLQVSGVGEAPLYLLRAPCRTAQPMH